VSDDSNREKNIDFPANNDPGNTTATSGSGAATQQDASTHYSGTDAPVHAVSSSGNRDQDHHSSDTSNDKMRPSDPDRVTTEKLNNETHRNNNFGKNHGTNRYMKNQPRPLHPPPSETRQAASKDFLQSISLQV
jgi:hypothetical protein